MDLKSCKQVGHTHRNDGTPQDVSMVGLCKASTQEHPVDVRISYT